jgi:cyclic pyranopterin phosphate synthase
MPEEGLKWLKNAQLLSTSEWKQMLEVLAASGITKIRFTGGEPTSRGDFFEIAEHAFNLKAFHSIGITTNGTFNEKTAERFFQFPWDAVNLSIDSLNEERFFAMTKRNEAHRVQETLENLILKSIKTSINAVILEHHNEEDIIELAQLTKDYDIKVRFIEEMPFNGKEYQHAVKWNWKKLEQELSNHFPSLTALPFESGATAQNYTIDGHAGQVGIIAAYSRTFCGTCNRIRITPEGFVKSCLYAPPSLLLRTLLREGKTNAEIQHALEAACLTKPKDGFAAEEMQVTKNFQSMASVGG